MDIKNKISEYYASEGLGSVLKRSLQYFKNEIRPIPSQLKIFALRMQNSNGIIIRNIQGSKMKLNLKDKGISRELALTGVHEANSTKFYNEFIKEGWHIAEIGANIGYYALLGAKIVGPKGFIYAFEPSEINFENLKENIQLNQFENQFELHNLALGATETEIPFYISTKGNMSSFICRDESGDIHTVKTVSMKVISGDSFFENKRIDFLRMDVEGFEIEIIKGLKKVLSRENKPQGLFIEIHSSLLAKRDTSAQTFVEELCSYGYEIAIAMYRGRKDIAAYSKKELLAHELLEVGYWETYFTINN